MPRLNSQKELDALPGAAVQIGCYMFQVTPWRTPRIALQPQCHRLLHRLFCKFDKIRNNWMKKF